jgi:hypothetical protein
MRQKSPRQIGSSLQSVLADLGMTRRLKEFEAVDVWAEVVGSHIASVARADRMDAGTLIVRVERATWRNELQYLKQELIDRLNGRLHEQIVTDIVFR